MKKNHVFPPKIAFWNKNKMKNILIIGPSRSGKTTLSTLISKKYNYSHIIMDAHIETMNDVFPELNIKHGKLDEKNFIKYFKSYLYNLYKYKQKNIIDLEVLDPKTADQIVNRDETVVIYLGYPNITVQDKFKQIRKYDTDFDWTKTLPDEELYEMLDKLIDVSRAIKRNALKYDFIFIDVSENREEKFKKFISEMKNNKEFILNPRCQDKYKRVRNYTFMKG